MAFTSECSRSFFGPQRDLDSVFFCTDPDTIFSSEAFQIKKNSQFLNFCLYVGTFTAVFIF
jgi:hypothetical protein